MNKTTKLTAHQMELSPDAFAVRRGGTDIMTKAMAAVKRVQGENITPVAKFKIIDSISDEIYKLTESLSILQGEVDMIAGKYAPENE